MYVWIPLIDVTYINEYHDTLLNMLHPVKSYFKGCREYYTFLWILIPLEVFYKASSFQSNDI